MIPIPFRAELLAALALAAAGVDIAVAVAQPRSADEHVILGHDAPLRGAGCPAFGHQVGVALDPEWAGLKCDAF